VILRDLGALVLAAGLVVAATVVPEGWETFTLSGVAGLTIGLACWDGWRAMRTRRDQA
jgi:hypothetical protein